MNRYKLVYDNGEFNYVSDVIYADSLDEAEKEFIAKWGVKHPELIETR